MGSDTEQSYLHGGQHNSWMVFNWTHGSFPMHTMVLVQSKDVTNESNESLARMHDNPYWCAK